MRQVLSKAAERGVRAFVASADVEGACDGIQHENVTQALLRKGVHPGAVCSLLRESVDLRGRSSLPGAPVSPEFQHARGTRQGKVLDNALREPAARWEAEGIGFRVETDNRRAQKKRRGPSGNPVENGGRVLHHLCCADDLYAMAGTMDHLTRILRDMTNSVEQLGMQWKGKSLTLVAGPYTEYKAGDVVEIFSNKSTMGVAYGGGHGGSWLVAGFSWLLRG